MPHTAIGWNIQILKPLLLAGPFMISPFQFHIVGGVNIYGFSWHSGGMRLIPCISASQSHYSEHKNSANNKKKNSGMNKMLFHEFIFYECKCKCKLDVRLWLCPKFHFHHSASSPDTSDCYLPMSYG